MDIAARLSDLSLKRYAEAFRDNAIELGLPELTETDLSSVGFALQSRSAA